MVPSSTVFVNNSASCIVFAVAMEEPSLREMADYMESNREELFDKLTPPPSGGNSNKQVIYLCTYMISFSNDLLLNICCPSYYYSMPCLIIFSVVIIFNK